MAITNKRGIFAIIDVRERQATGNWSVKDDIWLTPSPFFAPRSFGYFGAGYVTYPTSSVDRIDYSNDIITATTKGPLSLARYGLAATGNGSFGYFGGGYSTYTTVDRLDYGNDTATAVEKGPLNTARHYYGATGNASFGYFGGGEVTSTVDRIDYSNDTATASPKGPLTQARGAAAAGNQSFGYFGGGRAPANTTTVDRIDYSNDTATASPKGPLTVAKGIFSATGNDSFGYFGGGYPSNSTVDRIDYSNDTATASPKGTIAGRQTSATGNASFGYFAGGHAPAASSYVDRVDYSNDTATAIARGKLSIAKGLMSAVSERENGFPQDTNEILKDAAAGGLFNFATNSIGTPNTAYFAGGYNTPSTSTTSIERIDYSNDTATASPKGTLSAIRGNFDGTGNTSFGYYSDGWAPGLQGGLCDRIDYANDTATAAVRGPVFNVFSVAGVGNESFGYFGGGCFSGPNAKLDVARIDYSNDDLAAVAKGPLTLARFGLAATGDASYAWFAGGSTTPGYTSQKSTVDRIDYSNDTATAVAKGPLTAARKYLGGTGNASFGYFGGGDLAPGTTQTSIVDRIDYSNDTATLSPKGPLSVTRTGCSATGDSSFGYFGGGYITTPISVVDRVDYSNDTATLSPKGSFTVVRSTAAGTSARANGFSPIVTITLPTANAPRQIIPPILFGYFAGGQTAPSVAVSSVERINYTNDTATSLTRGNMLSTKSRFAGTGNADFGYFGDPSGAGIDRLDYANDTVDALSRGPSLYPGPGKTAATGTKDFGYFHAGYPPYAQALMSRLDYSNDTATATPSGSLASGRIDAMAAGNQSFGYFVGGRTSGSGNTASVNRIDYANDTATAVAKGDLVTARTYFGAVANANFGYFGGGRYPSPTLSSVDRIDFSNDTATAVEKGPLSVARKGVDATGNDNFGYFGGGNSGSYVTTVDRIDYSNDTATLSPKGPLSAIRYFTAAVSAAENALPSS